MAKRVKRAREAQRRRTRAAIVDATMKLMAAGHTPTLADVTKAADVSRRTIYMYFPTFEQLLLDATVGALSATTVDPVVAAAADDDAAARVEALSRAVSRHAGGMMHLGRALIRLTVGTDEPSGGAPRRGYRRVEWIEKTLEPARTHLAPAAFARLVSALSVLIGWEAEIVLRDVRGLTQRQAEDVVAWATRALVDAALAPPRRQAPRRRR
jgi:AcrR family transcriptional regulator